MKLITTSTETATATIICVCLCLRNEAPLENAENWCYGWVLHWPGNVFTRVSFEGSSKNVELLFAAFGLSCLPIFEAFRFQCSVVI